MTAAGVEGKTGWNPSFLLIPGFCLVMMGVQPFVTEITGHRLGGKLALATGTALVAGALMMKRRGSRLRFRSQEVAFLAMTLPYALFWSRSLWSEPRYLLAILVPAAAAGTWLLSAVFQRLNREGSSETLIRSLVFALLLVDHAPEIHHGAGSLWRLNLPIRDRRLIETADLVPAVEAIRDALAVEGWGNTTVYHSDSRLPFFLPEVRLRPLSAYRPGQERALLFLELPDGSPWTSRGPPTAGDDDATTRAIELVFAGSEHRVFRER